jgi:excisionase family DNA binding protein
MGLLLLETKGKRFFERFFHFSLSTDSQEVNSASGRILRPFQTISGRGVNANLKVEARKPNGEAPALGGESSAIRFLTREELAEALKISVRTVDTMVAGGEIPHLRLHGNFIRFYLPDVVRHLTATALISKRRWAGPRRQSRAKKSNPNSPSSQ